MIEQKKMDAELRQIVTDALVSMVSGVTGLVPPSGPGAIPDFIQAPIDRAVEKISASLPAGVPDESMVEMAAAAYDRAAYAGATHEQAWHEALSVALSAPAAPTVKAEQPEGSLADAVRVLLEVPQLRGKQAHSAQPIIDRVRALLEAPSLPAAGSAVEEVDVVGWLETKGRYAGQLFGTAVDGSEPLMTVAQHNRIVAALSAQQAGAVSVPDTARLDFMLSNWRKVVCERLRHDNFEVYVEEGFMGDKRYPSVRYSGEWEQGSPEGLEIQREAIDAAMLNGGGA